MKNEYFSQYSEIPLLLLDEEILLAGKKKRRKKGDRRIFCPIDATAAATGASTGARPYAGIPPVYRVFFERLMQ